MGWERNHELDFSEQTLVFKPTDGGVVRFQLPEPLEDKIRLVLLDLRGIEHPPAEFLKQLCDVAWQLKSDKRRLALLTDNSSTYLAVTDVLIFSDQDKYYDWLAHHEFYRKLTDPVPLFTFTKEELDDMLANSRTISDVLAELEAMDEVAA